ncbi:MAG: LPS assembly protein LptD [Archangiaceae bacterium]|nr:LPS assembly protein LptD [Archangiaceae bacterium]
MSALPLVVALSFAATVQLDAERLVHDDARKVTTAEGEAELTAGNAALHAERITWDENAEAATASGKVVLRVVQKGLLAVVADVVTVRMSNGEVSEVYLYDGIAMRKKNTTPQALLAARTPEQLAVTGNTTMTMVTSHLTRNDDGSWVIDELGFTPCECDFDRPSWHIGTSRTTLDLEAERASLLFPTFYVWKVPVLWLSWISLPLSDRQTGLLVPRLTSTALNGFSIEQPIFVTLGRSADMTITPAYYAGNGGAYGISGPRLGTEFRWAPSVGTSGRATLGVLWDLRLQRDPENPAVTINKRRGIRVDGTIAQVQELGHGFHDRLNVSLLSDGNLLKDFTPDVLAREATYMRSSASLFHRGADHFAGLDVVFRQDLATGDTLFTSRPDSPNPVQRLPGLVFAVPSRIIAGPLSVSGRAEYARLAPLLKRGDSLEPFDRFDVMPRVDVAGTIANAVSLGASASWRQDVWLSELDGHAAHRGYPLFGATASTELARTFSDSVRHTISPQIEARAVPAVVGSGTPPRYDDVDSAITGPAAQAVALLRQRLQVRGQGDVIRWDLGQSFNLWPTLTTGETFTRLQVAAGIFRTNATVRFDPLLKKVTRVSLIGSLDDGRGRGAYLSYENLSDVGTDRARQPIDLLIGSRLVPGAAAQVLAFGGHWRVGGLGLRYDSLFLNLDQKWPTQQTVGVSYGPACECWRVEVWGTYRGEVFPDFGASLTISGFGTLGTGG